MSGLVVVSNRVPIPDSRQPQAGGLAVALQSALEKHGGLWFGWDGQVSQGPVSRPRIARHANVEYATLPLSREDYDNYYLGYSNAVLWAVCHFNLRAMSYHREYVDSYVRTNRLFADALAPLLEGEKLIWVHDYHMIPLGRELRARGIRQRLGFFLHIPFPAYDVIRAMPGYCDRLRELCSYDLIGFQTRNDRLAFEEAVVHALGAELESECVIRLGERRVRTGVYPVGVDVEGLGELAARSAATQRVKRLVQDLSGRDLVVGVDRLDYSKGLPERFRAYEHLLEYYPHRRRHTVYMQIASPSRESILEYEALRHELDTLAGHVNGLYGDIDWVPIHYLTRTFARASLMGLYREARVGLVTPLRDGMNLVAKEFVAAQDPDNPGVLVLSELAGAARELDAAIMVNPYDVDAIAAALNEALAMPLGERRQRHAGMMDILTRNDIAHWHQRFLDDLQAAA
jgi:trehalose 6-phosphate synthase